MEPHPLDDIAADALSCKAFYDLPVSREQLDLARIMEDDQRDISWSSVEIDEDSSDGLFSFHLQYVVFDPFPDAEFTDTINQIIQNSVCFSYDNYEETNKVYTNHGQYGERNSGDVTVLFANPELACVQMEIFAGDSGKGTIYNRLVFNPTTGRRYRLHNFVEVSPDFVAEYIILPQQNASHDLELITDIYEQAGMDGLNEILSGDSSAWDEFWDIDMARWFIGRYLEFYNKVDNGIWDCFWVDDGQLWIKSGFDNLMEYRAIPLSELATYLYKES